MAHLAMLTSPAGDLGSPQMASLGRDVVLLTWDMPRSERGSPSSLRCDGQDVWPSASLRLSLSGGGERLFWVFQRPVGECPDMDVRLETRGFETAVTIDADAALPPVDVDSIIGGLDSHGRVALASALFNVWGTMFRLRRERAFIDLLGDILSQMAPAPGPAVAVAQIANEFLLARTSLVAGFGKIDAIYTFGRHGPTHIHGTPHRVPDVKDGREVIHLLIDRARIPADDPLLILIGPGGLSIRRLLKPDARLPSIERWFHEQAHAAPSLREHVLREIGARSEAGPAYALELQLRSPLRPRRLSSSPTAPSAEIVSALATSAGTLVTGWYRDPVNLFAGIEASGPEGEPLDLTRNLFTFPVEVAGPTKGSRLAATGFAVLAPTGAGAVQNLQPRFHLRLKSGARHSLVPHPQPADPAEARAMALRAVPAQHVDQAVLTQVLRPAIADLHAAVQNRIGRHTVRRIGVSHQRPKASMIIPLYRNLEFLRFQIAAFASDQWIRAHAELVYVLDSPEQAQEVEHLLGGLHLIYGLPLVLVIMERNGGYARANNVGVSVAQGEVLALVNSDIIPVSPGWLEAMASRLNGRRRIGAVGPKLLFEDGSIQHAGMYFSQDHRGYWLNQHFHKGMPRDYAPACEERVVPAVTGACLVTTRALFESVGGFTEDYVVGDYEDSDLCLKITMTERKIAYVPDIELYHLERKSMSLNAEYMRGIAWQYNCALHTERWREVMITAMQTGRPRKGRNAAI
ncbi:glycosyltransferase [Microvirga yunnanensis]|uniref:glycosyltransferase n=1 Tax=Microvirga yunnanensis TaxID=2953740 RepID=UPI0021C747B6|nr:glycosyltransferase [Microvirga sp. HBU65207]